MPLLLQPVEVADIPALTVVIFAAFASDPLHAAMFPRAYQESYLEWYYARLGNNILHEPALHNLKVVDSDTNDVIAFGRWEFPIAKSRKEHTDSDTAIKPNIPFPKNANKALIDDYLEVVYDKRSNWIDHSKDYVLQMLATHPDHQGRGAGLMLVRYGLEAADENNAVAFLEATPRAYQLYRKLGWTDVDNINMDLEAYGIQNQEIHQTIFMRRPSIRSGK